MFKKMTEKDKNLIMIRPNDHILCFFFLQEDSVFLKIH